MIARISVLYRPLLLGLGPIIQGIRLLIVAMFIIIIIRALEGNVIDEGLPSLLSYVFRTSQNSECVTVLLKTTNLY